MFIKNQNTIFIQLLKLFAPYKKKITCILFCLLVFTAASISYPLLNKILIDEGVMKHNFNTVVMISAAMFGVFGVSSIAEVLKEFLRADIASRVHQSLVENVFKSYLIVDIAYFKDRNSAELLNDLNVDIGNINKVCDNTVFFVITQLVSCLGGIAGLFIIDYRLSLLVFLFFPLKYFTVRFFSDQREKKMGQLLEKNTAFGHWFGDALNAIRDVRLFGLQKRMQQEAARHVFGVADSQRQLNILQSMNLCSEVFLMHSMEVLLLLVGAYFILDKTLTLGSLFAFISYSMQVLEPISATLNLKFMFSGIIPSATRYFQLLDHTRQAQELSGSAPLEQIRSVEFKNVSFSYGENRVLDKANFVVQKGDKVAVIGANGSGKSTLFTLIERLAVPDEGQVLINGITAASFDLQKYRAAFAAVGQDSFLLNRTVEENVCMGSSCEAKNINDALARAGLRDLAFDDIVGENGKQVSSGQRQKILFARALLRNTEWFLFDEITSNMDSEAARNLFGLLHGELKDKTVIMIVHDMKLLTHFDYILEVGRGCKVQVHQSYEDITVAESGCFVAAG